MCVVHARNGGTACSELVTTPLASSTRPQPCLGVSTDPSIVVYRPGGATAKYRCRQPIGPSTAVRVLFPLTRVAEAGYGSVRKSQAIEESGPA